MPHLTHNHRHNLAFRLLKRFSQTIQILYIRRATSMEFQLLKFLRPTLMLRLFDHQTANHHEAPPITHPTYLPNLRTTRINLLDINHI